MNCSNGCGCGNNSSRNGHYVEENICLSPELIKSWYEYNPNTNVLTDKEKALIHKAAKDGVVLGHGLTDTERNVLAAIILGGGVYSKVEVTSLLGTKVDKSVNMGLSHNDFTDAYKQILDSGISGVSQTPAQVKIAYESNPDTNAYTNAERIKLQNIEGSHFKGVHTSLAALTLAHPAATSEAGSYAYINNGTGTEELAILDANTSTWVSQVQTSSVPLTGVQIKALYEANVNTNAFTDGDKTKLASAITSLPPVIDITGKVDKVVGKQLSTEDYTTAEKTKLATIEGSHFKGIFPTVGDLQTANPTSEAGGYAYLKSGTGDEQLVMWDGIAWEVLTSGGGTAPILTSTQIKALYESNPDTNVLTDTAKASIASALQTHQDITGKVDKVVGKDLSTNDYSNTDKALVASALQTHQDITGKVDVVVGKTLTSNDYTNTDKALVGSALQAHQDISTKVDVVAGMGLSSNDYTTAEKLKLSTLEGSHFKGSHPDEAALLLAHPTAEPGSYAYVMDSHSHDQMYVWDDANSTWENLGHTSAVHMTDAQIKTQYENNPDTNVFDDAEKAKLLSLTLGVNVENYDSTKSYLKNSVLLDPSSDDVKVLLSDSSIGDSFEDLSGLNISYTGVKEFNSQDTYYLGDRVFFQLEDVDSDIFATGYYTATEDMDGNAGSIADPEDSTGKWSRYSVSIASNGKIYNESLAYYKGDVVNYNDELYQALTYTVDNDPDTSTNEWKLVCDGIKSEPIGNEVAIKNMVQITQVDYDAMTPPRAVDTMYVIVN